MIFTDAAWKEDGRGFWLELLLDTPKDGWKFLEDFKPGEWEADLKKHRKRRSLDANAYFHVLVDQIAKVTNKPFGEVKIELNRDYGTFATDKEGDIVFAYLPSNADMSTFYDYYRKIGDNGEMACYAFIKRTSELNSAEFSKLLEGTVQEAEALGIETLREQEIKELIREYEKRYSG